MPVQKITDIGGFNRLRKEGIGFTACVTEVLHLIPTIESKGIYIHMLSKPDDWKFYRTQLCDELKIGKDKLSVHLGHLIKLGLVREEEQRNELGQFLGSDLIVNLGIEVRVKIDSPQADYPAPEKPASGKSATTKLKTNNKAKETYICALASQTSQACLVFEKWKEIFRIEKAIFTKRRENLINKVMKNGIELSKKEIVKLTYEQIIKLFEDASKNSWLMGTSPSSTQSFYDLENLLTIKQITKFLEGNLSDKENNSNQTKYANNSNSNATGSQKQPQSRIPNGKTLHIQKTNLELCRIPDLSKNGYEQLLSHCPKRAVTEINLADEKGIIQKHECCEEHKKEIIKKRNIEMFQKFYKYQG